MNKKKTLAEVKEILEAGDEYLSSLTIPKLKRIIFDDLGCNQKFVNENVRDHRKLLDWFLAAKIAFNLIAPITYEEWKKLSDRPFTELTKMCALLGYTKETLTKYGQQLESTTYEKAIVDAIQKSNDKQILEYVA